MTNKIYSLLGVFAVITSFLYIYTELFHHNILNTITSIIILIFCIISFPFLTNSIKFMLTSFGILAIIISFTLDHPMQLFLEGLRSNLPLISLFILSSMLSIIVRNANYIQALKTSLKKFSNNPYFYYINTFILTHLFGIILNISTVQINLHLSKAYNIKSMKLITRILNRGFTTTLYWSPYFSATALVLTNLSVGWGEIAFISLGFVILSIVLSFIIDLAEINKESNRLKAINSIEDNKINEIDKSSKIDLIQLFTSIILLCILTIIVEKYILHNMVLTICILSIIYPLLWSLFTSDLIRYKVEMKLYFNQVLPNFKQEISLFTMAGLISTLFAASPLRFYLIDFLVYISDFSIFIVLWTICVSIIMSAIIGLHPIFLVTLLVTSVNPESLNIDSPLFAVLLLVSWGISNNVSPITAVNGILSRSFNISLKTVSLLWNWKFSFILIIILPIYLLLLT